MNKNLKKVISAVAVLALSASSISAFATNFPDVEATASYAQAVQELSALKVISGYDDGTFKPDNLVTRAEISKMIVDALAEGNTAAASSSTSKFADVRNAGSNGHWATGYINQGVTDGWIAGYDDNSFGPDDNVTYVQAQKMLVAAVGYDIYANAKGGWPAGYKMYAASLDITNGVQGVTSDDQQLTRAQVAQMIDNAMDAPLCVIDDYKVSELTGQQIPQLKVKDGEGKEYQTLFTNKHDAYKVFGRVTATSKTETGLDTDKVMFKVEKADNFDDEYVKASDDREPEEMFFGDTDAENMLRTYAQALIQKNDDDEYTLLSITAAAANKSVSLLAEDVDDSKSNVAEGVLYFYPAGQTRGSVKYQLADSVDYYVNGVSMGTFDDEALEQYIINNDTALVTLQKETATGSTNTSSKYNVIMITTYATAVVDQVIDKTDEVSVNFKAYSNSIKPSMKLKKDDESYKYTLKLNGEEIEPTDLEKYDVLSISYDVGDGSRDAFGESTFYDVIVSRDNTVTGRYTGKNSTGDEFTIGGTKYKMANGISASFETSTDYTLYLDNFGRIAYTDEEETTKKIGILTNVYQKNNGDWIAEVITRDSTKPTEFTLDDKDGATYEALIKNSGSKVADYPQQVIEYKTTTAGKLTIKGDIEALTGVESGDKAYKAATSKLGSLKISDNTTIIDISNVDNKKNDYKIISKDSLRDGTYYTAYGFDKSNSDSVYRFVIITEGIGGIDSTSELAVFVESGTAEDSEGNEVDTMTLIVNGEKTSFNIDTDSAIDVDAFAEGDLLVYSTTTAGDIDQAIAVFANSGIVNDADDFDAFRDGIFKDSNILADVDWVDELSDGDQDNVNIAFGAIVKPSNSSTYTLAKMQSDANGTFVDLNDPDNIDLTMNDQTKIYTYNFKLNKKNANRLVLDNGMMATTDVDAAYAEDDDDIYYLSHEDVAESVVFAVVRTFDDDEAQEIYLILND